MDDDRKRKLEQMARSAVRTALKAVEGLSPEVVTHLIFCLPDPDELRVHLAFRDRTARLEARESGHQEKIRQEVMTALQAEGYPECKRLVDFVSVEEVDAQGGPWKYFR